MFIYIVRSTIIYFILYFILRVMGKRQVGELQPFELVMTLILAELATLPMQETGLSLINGIVPLLTLVTIHFLISFLSRKSFFARKIICGKPVIIVNPDGIQYEKLKELNMNINDLQEALRGAGYFTFEEIDYAIIETNGKLSVLPKSLKRPVTPKDLKLNPDKAPLDVALIIDGKIIKANLKKLKVSERFIYKYLKKANIKELKELLLVTLGTNGLLLIQKKNTPAISFQTSFKGGVLK